MDELDKILDSLLTFSPSRGQLVKVDGTVRNLTGNEVRAGAKAALIAWRDKEVERELEKLIKGQPVAFEVIRRLDKRLTQLKDNQ